MDLKKLDIKSVFIIILGIALIISFLFGHKSTIDTHVDEIKNLEHQNQSLINKNDSIINVNAGLDKKIATLSVQIDDNNKVFSQTQSQLNHFNNEKNEISKHINTLSGNDVASSLSNTLNKGTNNH